MSKSDPYLIERIVGYHEYGRALHYLDRLVASCDPYELEAIDDIIRAEPEFAIYTVSSDGANQNGPGGAGVPEQPNENAEIQQDPSANSVGGRKRHGLRWVTALARVELGAMYAGFSISPRPFSHAATPAYDADEFRFLLTESARVHFWTLSKDPLFHSLVANFQPNSVTLAYLRRMNVATAFAIASGQASMREYPKTVSEMAGYAQRLQATRSGLQTQLVQPRIVAVATQVTSQLTLTELCNEGICRQFASP